MEKIEKPWGYEVIWAKTDKYVAKFLHINPHSRMSLQFHKEKEETIYVMAGELKLQLDICRAPELCRYRLDKSDSFQLLGPGSIHHVKPGDVHRFGAGARPVMLCEVSTPELDDVVRLADDYKRSN